MIYLIIRKEKTMCDQQYGKNTIRRSGLIEDYDIEKMIDEADFNLLDDAYDSYRDNNKKKSLSFFEKLFKKYKCVEIEYNINYLKKFINK